MIRLKSNKIAVENFIRLTNIFHIKNWPTHNDDQVSDDTLFNRFCYLLANLRDDEQELILTITEDFLRCTYYDYPLLMQEALKKIDKKLMDDCKKIIMAPLISPKDVTKGIVKSAHTVLYPILRMVIPNDPELSKYKNKVIAINNVDSLNSTYGNRQDNLLLFFDDFIGSGKTACDALWDYWINYRVESDSIAVVALVAQYQGLTLLNRLFFNVYASHVRKRGISDSEKIGDVDKSLSIMDRIENSLAISKYYRRGFGKSEALVSMMRTPNNTFPVYWCIKAKNGEVWPAPFRR
jgi:hypothetical protein